MFIVKNAKSGKAVKNVITCTVMTFETKEYAEIFAHSMTRNSMLNPGGFRQTAQKYVATTA